MPTQEQVEKAVETLIRWAGDDPSREGLQETPKRVAKAYREFFSGYGEDPQVVLSKTFEETEGYDEMVVLSDIPFESHCEHHMVPFIGKAHVGYIPDKRVVGISKLARVVNIYARRLQIQEKLTVQIAQAIEQILKPKGVGVIIESTHQCMTLRGVRKAEARMVTSHLLGSFRASDKTRQEFLQLTHKGR